MKNLFSKKVFFGGMLFLAFFISIASAMAITASTSLTPAEAYTDTVLTLNATCTSSSDSTMTVYWDIYKNSSKESSSSATISNNTEMQLATIATSKTAKNQEWYAEVYCSNGTVNSSAVNTSTITILNSAPVLSSSSITINAYEDSHDKSLSASDKDSDSLTYEVIASGDSNIATCSVSGSKLTATRKTEDSGTTSCTVRVSDSTQTDSETFNITVEKSSKLKIKNIDISGDVDSDDYDSDDISTVMDIKELVPGGQLKIEIEFENLYTDDEDVDIEDIEVDGTILDVDVGDNDEDDIDANDEKTIDKLEAEEEDSVELVFDIPKVIGDDSYDMEIEISADDDEDNDYDITLEFRVEVVKEDYDIYSSVELSPESISCGAIADLEVEIINIGDKDIEDIVVSVLNNDLGVDLTQTIDELDNDIDEDENSEKLNFLINVPESVEEKAYPIKITIQGEDDDDDKLDSLESSHSISLTVSGACSAETETAEQNDTAAETEYEEVVETVTDEKHYDVTGSVETPFTETNAFVMLMIAGIVLVSVLIVLLIIFGFRKS